MVRAALKATFFKLGGGGVIKTIYYMACVCSRYNASSDWLIVTEL